MGAVRNCIQLLFIGKPEGKAPLRRPRHRWEDNIKMEVREMMHLALDRDQWRAFVDTVMNLRAP
jgi:hypothetical protein